MINTDVRELIAQDRCDKCGAQAKVIATFLNGELMFCGHHAREVKASLQMKAATLYDPDNLLV